MVTAYVMWYSPLSGTVMVVVPAVCVRPSRGPLLENGTSVPPTTVESMIVASW